MQGYNLIISVNINFESIIISMFFSSHLIFIVSRPLHQGKLLGLCIIFSCLGKSTHGL